ncbi:MAG: ion transporter [Gammaproteobacteria bacterium]|jgi:voltage-gated sodium channel|nr:ion transporter [Gammaproteobacteria bacterium]MBT4491855.1 ion transporter [Gammaproteobacteria bacterium]MBT7370308.1 ion transporter [Gammaproteobacteria bacterium]
MTWQSRFDEILANKVFEFFIISVIMVSALTVGAKTYNISPVVLSILEVADVAVTVIFVIELSIRFMATHPKTGFLKNGWNVFDTIIVTISLIPIENSDMALVARLVRVFRVLRMISIVPELRMLMDSLLKALPRLGYVMAMLFIIFYIYAAIGSLFFESINPVLWGNVSIAMLTLFRVMTFEDWTDVMYETMAVYEYSWIFYLSFIFLTAFAFLNMVIGVVVNVLEEEHQKLRDEDPDILHLQDVYDEVKALRALVEEKALK